MKTLFVGQNSIHVESLDSTNSYATEMLRQIALVEGSMIYSFRQINGRGQRGNSWESEPNKNVALSLVLRPKFLSVERQFLLTKITSLAVSDLMAETLRGYSELLDIKIKWPNDIYVKGQKIAGILIENTLKETILQSSIVGVGINVNQVQFDSTKNAVSLFLSTGKEFGLMDLVDRFCELFEARYLQLKSGRFQDIDTDYLKRLYLLNEWAQYRSDGVVFEGKIIGVSSIGKLIVELKTSEVKEFDLKEIVFT